MAPPEHLCQFGVVPACPDSRCGSYCILSGHGPVGDGQSFIQDLANEARLAHALFLGALV
jgi:hypothetical protein